MSTQAKPQAPRKVKPRREIADVLLELEDWQKEFLRAYATYRTWTASLESFRMRQEAEQTGQPLPPQDERMKGLPILKTPVSADGRTVIEANIDLRDIDPQYVPHVMIPIINSQSGKMMEALDEIMLRVQELKQLLTPNPAPGPQQPNQVFTEPGGAEE